MIANILKGAILNLKIVSILILSYLSFPIFGESLKCKSLGECINKVSKLSNQQYTLGASIKGGPFEEVNFQGSGLEIESLLSQLLFQYGYTRVPSIGNSWMIISSRDLRYNPTPLLESGKDEIPNSYDYMMVAHQLKNKLKVKDVTRSFRPFMSRYGRIIAMKDQGKIIIQDTGININRLIGLLKMTDREATEDEIREAKRDKKFRQKLKLMEAKAPKCPPRKS
jgi:type II secretory pathway component GspD/PulD (secretin)